MHIPVLLQETIDGLNVKEGGVYVDCTTNRAGHSKEIAKRLGKEGTLICIDLDQDALKEARDVLETVENRPTYHFISSNYRYLKKILEDLHITYVDGIIADLGLSSQELDESKRGFTFRYDEPLLMTFASVVEDDMVTAKDIVNCWSESTIADILYGFADEKYSRRIAHAIVIQREEKEIMTTIELAKIVEEAVPYSYRHKKIHPATKTFQALRMAVNDELGSINDLILSLPYVLGKDGRACIITFHSTEDRVVKHTFKNLQEELTPITKKPIVPTQQEQEHNPRSRSAQLRIVKRV